MQRTRRATTVLVSLLGFGLQAQTPVRPMLPERRCTRVSLRADVDARTRVVALRVTNNDPGDFPARLRADLEVQQEVQGRWQRVSTAGLRLRARCTEALTPCVTVAPRESLTIVPWNGMLGDAQCECSRCAPAPAGRYRFVVTTCEQCIAPPAFESAVFVLP